MCFSIWGSDFALSFLGLNHYVEILQSYLFFYFVYAACLILLLNWTSDLKRFFFYSELAWLALFGVILAVSSQSHSTHLFSHAFLILIFTACEAVTLACLLLVAFEGRKHGTKV